MLNQHQKTDQCLKAVLERMNDEQEIGSTPMDIDDSDVNIGGVDVDASGDEPMDIVAPSTTGSPSIVPDNTLNSTAESSIQESSNVSEPTEDPIVYSRFDEDHDAKGLSPFTFQLFSIFTKFGASDTMKAELIHHINHNLLAKLNSQKREELDSFIPSHDTVKGRLKAVNRETEIIRDFDVCSNGWYLPHYTNELSRKPNQVVSLVSVTSFLADRLLDDDQRASFDYRHAYDTTYHLDGVYKDIFSGEVYRNLYRHRYHLFTGHQDIALIIVVDGFQPHSQSTSTLTTINLYIMSYSPMERSKKNNVVALGILPGPNKPSHLLSFLESIIYEIQELDQRGLSVIKNGEEIYNGKVHLMAVTGDIPAIGDMMGSARHMSWGYVFP
ncbi:hypothetical protein G6F56_010168 [Rhizopus delemar]|nr:hypothetical protein G6F56_010168 [Rhizopus delemar]